MKLISTSAPLVPRLACIRHARTRFSLDEGFLPTDLIHVVRDCEDHAAGTVLPILGYLLRRDVEMNVYEVRAYVPGFGTTAAGREAQRFPTALEDEVLFGSLPAFITELDITECADCLALERRREAVVIEMYPSTLRCVA